MDLLLVCQNKYLIPRFARAFSSCSISLSTITLILHKINGRIHLVNESVFDFLIRFEKSFYLKKAGTLLGEIKGGKLVPEQELAWSVNTSDNVAKIELTREQAIKFLKKENFLEGNHAQQLVLLTYKNYGLGWAKVLGNRVNNYLPNELRILK